MTLLREDLIKAGLLSVFTLWGRTSCFLWLGVALYALDLLLAFRTRLSPIRGTSGYYALVTGASQGLGREIALLLARKGFNLILAARSVDKLEALGVVLRRDFPSTDVAIVPCDLAEPEGARRLWLHLEKENLNVLDILVNNAGHGQHSEFETTDVDSIESAIFLNVLSFTVLTRLALQGMIERGRGRILQVSSAAAGFPNPLMAVYGATKAFQLSLSDAVGFELRGSGVGITTVCPGAIADTGFGANNNAGSSLIFRLKQLQLSANQVAAQAVEGLLAGAEVVRPGVFPWIGMYLGPLLPRRAVLFIVALFWSK